MKKKLICLFLAVAMMLSCFIALTSCDDPVCESHVDKDKDKKCDVCGEDVKGKDEDDCECEDKDDDGKCDKCGECLECVDNDEDGKCDNCGEKMEEEVIEYPWDTTSLIFQMTHHTDVDQLPSGCERYMAGEDDTAIATIDTYVTDRNSEAYATTKVSVIYQYWENVDEYSMSNVPTHIYNLTHSGTAKDNPDIYTNFNVAMVGCSLKGCFANIKSETKGTNYFEFNELDYDEEEDNRGYMMDYMENCTLSKHKMYVIASDYFIDMIRAFYIVPVNVFLLNSVGPEITGDRDGSGEFTIDDFYDQVKAKEWDYDLVAAYSEKVYEPAQNSTGGKSIHDTLGWALDTGGLAGSGMLYTTPITIVNKVWNDDDNDYEYSYPTESTDIYELCDNLRELMAKPGVYCVGAEKGNKEFQQYGLDGFLAVRNRFCDNKVLFGSPMLLGALEFETYQKLKDKSGFGVVPVPFYHEVAEDSDERYLTAIHNNARSGGIAVCTQKFSQCTAFLNYQSTHSTDILNEYYDYRLQYEIADGSKGTVEMLQYIRYNVRSNFDKTWEDAINGGYYDDCWHVMICSSGYSIDIRQNYGSLYQTKMDRLEVILKTYDVLPE